MDWNIIAALALVFFAVAAVINQLIPIVLQGGDKLPQEAAVIGSTDQVNDPIEYFTTRKRLQQSRLTAGVLSPCTVLGLAVAAGATSPVLLGLLGTGSCLLGYNLPMMSVRRKVKKREEEFQKRLVDLTLGLANGLRAGGSFTHTLRVIAADMGGPVAQEFNTVLYENEYAGEEIGKCLERMCKRVPNDDLLLLMTAVRITMEAGGSLATVLDKITETVRARADFQERLKTMTAQGRFQAIVVAAAPFFVFLLLILVDRELMLPLVTTEKGYIACAAVVALEILGFLWIRKIITIKV